MRVLLVTHDHPFRGRSGVAAYCQDLLPELRARGVEVFHLYTSDRRWVPGPAILRSGENGGAILSLVNSPAAPALSVDRPTKDCGDPRLDSCFAELFQRVQPDVLHVHALMGATASLLRVAARLRVPVVVTLHDFWVLCARTSLIRPDGTLCEGPDDGRNCARFCAGAGGWRRKLYRRLLATLPEGSARRLVERAGLLWRRARGKREPSAPCTGRPGHAAPYRERIACLMDSLALADRLLAVSQFVRDLYVQHGLPAFRVEVLPLGLRVTERVRPRVRSAATPVRFGYLGRLSPLKGAHLLAEAARAIPPAQARFLFFGPGSAATRAELRRLAGSRPLEFRGPYSRQDLSRILEEVDVVVVPTLFQETVGLTALEAQSVGVPVIASAVGALPEWVRDGENGLLFPPGDRKALQDRIRLLVENPNLVTQLSARARPPFTISDHTDHLLAVYSAVQTRGSLHV